MADDARDDPDSTTAASGKVVGYEMSVVCPKCGYNTDPVEREASQSETVICGEDAPGSDVHGCGRELSVGVQVVDQTPAETNKGEPLSDDLLIHVDADSPDPSIEWAENLYARIMEEGESIFNGFQHNRELAIFGHGVDEKVYVATLPGRAGIVVPVLHEIGFDPERVAVEESTGSWLMQVYKIEPNMELEDTYRNEGDAISPYHSGPRRTVNIDTTLSYHGDIEQQFAEALWPTIQELLADPDSDGLKFDEPVDVTGKLMLSVLDGDGQTEDNNVN